MGNKVEPIEKRFFKRVEKTETCWLWKTHLNTGGYGRFYNDEKRFVMAHRFSWEHFNGEIPEGLFILHKCDVRHCVNPDHLFIGTQQDNMDDMVKKKRQGDVKREKNSQAKLKEKDVHEIRRRFQDEYFWGIQSKLAKEYGVAQCTISNILREQRWPETKKEHQLR